MNEPSPPKIGQLAETILPPPQIGQLQKAILILVVVGTGWLVWRGMWRPVPRIANTPLPQAVYVWQRQWTGPVRTVVRSATGQDSAFSELLVFGAEIVATGSPTQGVSVTAVNGLDWGLLADAQRPVGIVVRVRGVQGAVEPKGKVFEALRETLASLCAQAKGAGLKLEEVQVDPSLILRSGLSQQKGQRHAKE